jgi:hypothetical protein
MFPGAVWKLQIGGCEHQIDSVKLTNAIWKLAILKLQAFS